MYTRKELAEMYNVCLKTMIKIIKQAGIERKKSLITPLEFEKLKKAIGEPVNKV